MIINIKNEFVFEMFRFIVWSTLRLLRFGMGVPMLVLSNIRFWIFHIVVHPVEHDVHRSARHVVSNGHYVHSHCIDIVCRDPNKIKT
jgi:hypothetical protein